MLMNKKNHKNIESKNKQNFQKTGPEIKHIVCNPDCQWHLITLDQAKPCGIVMTASFLWTMWRQSIISNIIYQITGNKFVKPKIFVISIEIVNKAPSVKWVICYEVFLCAEGVGKCLGQEQAGPRIVLPVKPNKPITRPSVLGIYSSRRRTVTWLNPHFWRAPVWSRGRCYRANT